MASDKFPRLELDDFRGISTREDVFDIQQGQFALLKNINRSRRCLETRFGTEGYNDRATFNFPNGVKRMARYRNSAGVKRVLAYSDGNVSMDADDGVFDPVDDIAFEANAEGYVEFMQYRDTMFTFAETRDPKLYNAGETPTISTPNMAPKEFTVAGADLSATTFRDGVDAYLPPSIYYWRVTFDIQMGSDFLGETGAAGKKISTTYYYSQYRWDLLTETTHYTESSVVVAAGGSGYVVGDLIKLAGGTPLAARETRVIVTSVNAGAVTGVRMSNIGDAAYPGLYTTTPANPVAQDTTTGVGTGATFTLVWKASPYNYIQFKRPSDAIMNAIPAYCTRINIYRSPAYSATTDPAIPKYAEDGEFYYVGSYDMEALRALAEGTVFFTDFGLVLGKQISYGLYHYPVRGRHATFFKGRLWLQDVATAPNDTGTYTEHPDAIMYSRFYSNAEEPLAFQLASPKITLDKFTGEGGTGLANWRGKVLLAFKPTRTDAIVGGDDFISPTLPNIQKEVLSDTIGCIAPRTIVTAEGAVLFLSHQGPMMFNGGPISPIGSWEIKTFLDDIPEAMRRLATAYYDSDDREYVIFMADSLATDYNRVAIRYSFLTRMWTTDRNPRGIGAALEIHESDKKTFVLFGRDDDPAYFAADGDPAIVKAKTAFTEDVEDADDRSIDWRFETGYLDGRHPLRDKKVTDVSIEGEWLDPFDLYFRVDGDTNTEADARPLRFEKPSGDRGVTTVEIPDDMHIEGTRIQFIGVGENLLSRTRITKIVARVELGVEKKERRIE